MPPKDYNEAAEFSEVSTGGCLFSQPPFEAGLKSGFLMQAGSQRLILNVLSFPLLFELQQHACLFIRVKVEENAWKGGSISHLVQWLIEIKDEKEAARDRSYRKKDKASLEHFAGDNGNRCETLMDLCFKDRGYMA